MIPHHVYYHDDKELQFYSPDPADPEQTTRVLTIMLTEEYETHPGKAAKAALLLFQNVHVLISSRENL